MDDDLGQARRTLLSRLAAGTGAAAAAGAVWPLAAAVLEPALAPGAASPDGAPWVDVAGERELREGFAPLKVVLRVPVRDGFFTTLVEVGAAFVRRTAKGELLALSATCPHLGCGLGQDPAGFACPCHDSRFSPEGTALKGPSPRAMDALPVRLAGGRVLVQALRFAAGVKQQRAL